MSSSLLDPTKKHIRYGALADIGSELLATVGTHFSDMSNTASAAVLAVSVGLEWLSHFYGTKAGMKSALRATDYNHMVQQAAKNQASGTCTFGSKLGSLFGLVDQSCGAMAVSSIFLAASYLLSGVGGNFRFKDSARGDQIRGRFTFAGMAMAALSKLSLSNPGHSLLTGIKTPTTNNAGA